MFNCEIVIVPEMGIEKIKQYQTHTHIYTHKIAL